MLENISLIDLISIVVGIVLCSILFGLNDFDFEKTIYKEEK